ncbi:DUF3817 domain-containing protein [Myroides ceti]|uniref:DUF3817 domain-containing protein n=1 Tax=Paenimyroides ceti TaxID=395087 RepID=A0ABT8D2R4_9FLAO|nr:DUF3817 domain-containing protein [Paenimyroides ceti]MDN3710198.1 DUF3817 domain-containing protein [Paenimyroides ceti]
MPLKYFFSYPNISQFIGPLHGALFLLFVFNTLNVGIESNGNSAKPHG